MMSKKQRNSHSDWIVLTLISIMLIAVWAWAIGHTFWPDVVPGEFSIGGG